MRRLCLIAALLIVTLFRTGAQESGNVYGSLHDYFEAVSVMPVDSINARLDVLIASAADDETRAGIAGAAYNFFLESEVMGAEGVSVYIADNYFLNKRLKWPSEATFPSLYAFAEFNRSSLLGMEAQPLTLESLEGENVNIRDAAAGYKILYFYEDQCLTCSRQTPLIVSLLDSYTGEQPVTLYAVYTQGDRDAWAKYAITHFRSIDNPKVRVFHLWDPEDTSEFHKKYAVLTTPSLLVLDSDNRIIGRKLDATALAEVIGQRESFDQSLYSLMDNVRDNLGLDTETVTDVCSVFAERIGNDDTLFRNTFRAIYNYLRSQDDYMAQQSAALVAEEYIIGRSDIWSPEYISLIADAVRRFNMNPLGAKAADATLLTKCGRQVKMLSKPGKHYTLIFFNLIACETCAEYKQQLKEMKPLLREKGVKVISVYVGPDKKEWKQSLGCTCNCYWRDLRTDWPDSDLYSLYDVSVAPKLYLLDSEGTVIAKDITPATLKAILE